SVPPPTVRGVRQRAPSGPLGRSGVAPARRLARPTRFVGDQRPTGRARGRTHRSVQGAIWHSPIREPARLNTVPAAPRDARASVSASHGTLLQVEVYGAASWPMLRRLLG